MAKASIDALVECHTKTLEIVHSKANTPTSFVVNSKILLLLDESRSTREQALDWTVRSSTTFEDTANQSVELSNRKKETELMKALALSVRDLGRALEINLGYLHRKRVNDGSEAKLDVHTGESKQFVFSNVRRMHEYAEGVSKGMRASIRGLHTQVKYVGSDLEKIEGRKMMLLDAVTTYRTWVTDLLRLQNDQNAVIRKRQRTLSRVRPLGRGRN